MRSKSESLQINVESDSCEVEDECECSLSDDSVMISSLPVKRKREDHLNNFDIEN